MGQFDSAISTALRLIKKNGRSITVSKVVVGAAPDASQPWNSGAVSALSQTTVGVFLNYEQRYIDGTSVRRGDQLVLVPALDTDPDVNGTITCGSEVWKIVHVDPLRPNGETIMYEVQVRQ